MLWCRCSSVISAWPWLRQIGLMLRFVVWRCLSILIVNIFLVMMRLRLLNASLCALACWSLVTEHLGMDVRMDLINFARVVIVVLVL